MSRPLSRVWTDEKLAAAVALHKGGATVNTIAGKLAINTQTVRRTLRELGHKPVEARRWTNDDKELLRQLVAEGLTDTEIARETSRTENAIKTARISLGLKREPARCTKQPVWASLRTLKNTTEARTEERYAKWTASYRRKYTMARREAGLEDKELSGAYAYCSKKDKRFLRKIR